MERRSPGGGGVVAQEEVECFIWRKMLVRQRRWWQHGLDGKPLRDEHARFIPSSENPLPALNPFDKSWERTFLESIGAPQPRLLAKLTRVDELLAIASTLPSSWVLKPVGAAYSDGVCVVHKGMDVTPSGRGEANCALASSKPLDLRAVVRDLRALTARGGREATTLGSQRTLEWNLSAWLIEEYVLCESGAAVPIDYRCYCCGGHVLWVGVNHLNASGQLGIAYVDVDYQVTPAVHDPSHIATFSFVPQEALPPRPRCWDAIVASARAVGSRLGVYVRLDYYADAVRGPLLGEATLSPNMTAHPSFFTPWANRRVHEVWHEPDGGDEPCTHRAGAAAATGAAATPVESLLSVTDLAPSTAPSTSMPREKPALSKSQSVATDSQLSSSPSSSPPPSSSPASLSDSASDTPSDMPRPLEPAFLKGDATLVDLAMPHGAQSPGPSVVSGVSKMELHLEIGAFDLSPWGIERGARVALMLPNGPRAAVTLLAVMGRYCAVPLAPDAPAEKIASTLFDAQVACILSCDVPAYAQRVRDAVAAVDRAHSGAPTLQISAILLRADPTSVSAISLPPSPPRPSPPIARQRPRWDSKLAPAVESPTVAAEDTVLVLHTSGTSSKPKMVPFTLRRLLAGGRALAESMHLNGADRGVNAMPLHHVGGISCNLIATLVSGGVMDFGTAFDPAEWTARCCIGVNSPITRYPAAELPLASWCYMVPSMWARVANHLESTLPAPPRTGLRVLRSGAAHLPHAEACRLVRLFAPGCTHPKGVSMLPTYSMTECMPIASPPMGYALQKPGSVGFAIGGLKVAIIDPDTAELLRAGSQGEIALGGGGAQRFNGYEGLPPVGKTSLFRTGDLGYCDADGWLYHCGRLKECINRGGELIAPAEVEAALCGAAPAVDAQSLVVFSTPHEDFAETVAVAVRGSPASVTLASLRAWGAKALPAASLPQLLVYVDELPRSGPTGKLQRIGYAQRLGLPSVSGGSLRTFMAFGDVSRGSCQLDELDEAGRVKSGPSPTPAEAASRDADILPRATSLPPALERVLEVVQSIPSVGGRAVDPDVELSRVGIGSLEAVDVVTQLRALTPITLPITLVFEHQTARAVGAFIEAGELATGVPTERESHMAQSTTAADGNKTGSGIGAVVEGAALRCVMLHGRAANAEMMREFMFGSGWHSALDGAVVFEYAEAMHECAPQPDLYEALHTRGAYGHEPCFDWGFGLSGLSEATRAERIAEALAAVVTHHLDEPTAPCDAIGGICEGALVAAAIAQRRPELRLFLNFCGTPWTSLPASEREGRAEPLRMPSVHLIGRRDEMLDLAKLMSLPHQCVDPVVIVHDGGHVVPPAKPAIIRQVLAAARLAAFATPGSGTGDIEMGPPGSFTNGAAADDVGLKDSLGLVISRSRLASNLTLDHFAFLGSFIIFLHHYRPWECTTVSSEMSMLSRKYHINLDTCAPTISFLHSVFIPTAIPTFALLSGLRYGLRRRGSALTSAKQAAVLLVLGLLYSRVIGPWFTHTILEGVVAPSIADSLRAQSHSMRWPLEKDDPRFHCGKTKFVWNGIQDAWWAWFLVLLGVYKAIDAFWAVARLPPWALGVLSLCVHIACVGGQCPFPLCVGAPEHLAFDQGHSHCHKWFPLQMKPVFVNATRMWPYYALLPLLLPTHFPNELPFEHPVGMLQKYLAPRRQVHPTTIARAVRVAWLAAGFMELVSRDFFSQGGVNHYHLFKGPRGAYLAILDFKTICVMLVATGAAMPRPNAPTIFSWAGARALSFYLIHVLVTPIVHPYPNVQALIARMRTRMIMLPEYGGLGILANRNEGGLGFQTGLDVTALAGDLLLLVYLVGVRFFLAYVAEYLEGLMSSIHHVAVRMLWSVRMRVTPAATATKTASTHEEAEATSKAATGEQLTWAT